MLFSINLKVLDTQVGSETWNKCFSDLKKSDGRRTISVATQRSFYILLKDFTDDNIGHSVIDYHPFYRTQYS